MRLIHLPVSEPRLLLSLDLKHVSSMKSFWKSGSTRIGLDVLFSKTLLTLERTQVGLGTCTWQHITCRGHDVARERYIAATLCSCQNLSYTSHALVANPSEISLLNSLKAMSEAQDPPPTNLNPADLPNRGEPEQRAVLSMEEHQTIIFGHIVSPRKRDHYQDDYIPSGSDHNL